MDEAQIVMEHQKAPFDLPLLRWKPSFVDEIEHSHATVLLLNYKSCYHLLLFFFLKGSPITLFA